MDMELLQSIIQIVFGGNLLYLSPLLVIMMSLIYGEKIIELIRYAIKPGNGRRARY